MLIATGKEARPRTEQDDPTAAAVGASQDTSLGAFKFSSFNAKLTHAHTLAYQHCLTHMHM